MMLRSNFMMKSQYFGDTTQFVTSLHVRQAKKKEKKRNKKICEWKRKETEEKSTKNKLEKRADVASSVGYCHMFLVS